MTKPPILLVALGAVLLAACSRQKTIATVAQDVDLLGAFLGRVYWREGATLSYMQDGLEKPQSFSFEGADWASRGNFALDSSGVYYSHHSSIAHLNYELTKFEPWGENQLEGWTRQAGEHPTGAALDEQRIYTLHTDVECHGRGGIVSMSKSDGGSYLTRDAPVNGLQPLEFQMDADYFYWVDGGCPDEFSPPGGTIKALPRRSGSVVIIASREASIPQDLQVGTRGLYWRTKAGIRFAAKPPGPPSTLVTGEVRLLTVAGSSVFYANRTGIYWLRENAPEPRRLVEEPGIRGIVADARFLYWLSSKEMKIVRMRRPD
jgi:hypothetical protein